MVLEPPIVFDGGKSGSTRVGGRVRRAKFAQGENIMRVHGGIRSVVFSKSGHPLTLLLRPLCTATARGLTADPPALSRWTGWTKDIGSARRLRLAASRCSRRTLGVPRARTSTCKIMNIFSVSLSHIFWSDFVRHCTFRPILPIALSHSQPTSSGRWWPTSFAAMSRSTSIRIKCAAACARVEGFARGSEEGPATTDQPRLLPSPYLTSRAE